MTGNRISHHPLTINTAPLCSQTTGSQWILLKIAHQSLLWVLSMGDLTRCMTDLLTFFGTP